MLLRGGKPALAVASVGSSTHLETLRLIYGLSRDPDLLGWVGAMSRRPQRTFLVHGEGDAQPALAQALKDRFGMQVDVPELGQTVTV